MKHLAEIQTVLRFEGLLFDRRLKMIDRLLQLPCRREEACQACVRAPPVGPYLDVCVCV